MGVRRSFKKVWWVLALFLVGIPPGVFGQSLNGNSASGLKVFSVTPNSFQIVLPPLPALRTHLKLEPEEAWTAADKGEETESEVRVIWIEVPPGGEVKVEDLTHPLPPSYADPLGQSHDPGLWWRWGEEISVRGRRLKPILIVDANEDRDRFPQRVLQVTCSPLGETEQNDGRREGRVEDLMGERILSPWRDRANESSLGAWVYVIPRNQRVREIVAPLVEWRKRQGYVPIEITVDPWMGSGWIKQQLRGLWARGQVIDYICLIGDATGEIVIPPADTRMGESDYSYGLLEGEDMIPEAAVGRISCGSYQELERVVNKILTYEQNPPRENLQWYRRGAVLAASRISGVSPILASRWAREVLLRAGYAQVDTFWWTMGQQAGDFIERALGEGISILTYRGWTGVEGWTVQRALRMNNRLWPLALLLTCNTGDFGGPTLSFSEALLRSNGGAIAAVGEATSGGRVHMNNLLLTSFMRAVYEDGLVRVGWALNRAKIDLWAVYGDRQRGMVEDHLYWVNLMGDPATLIWTGPPRQVTLQAPQEIVFTDGGFIVTVRDGQNNQPLSGARVSLLKEGELQASAFSDQNGEARIRFSPRGVTPGNAIIQVCGDRILPANRNLRFLQPNQFLMYQSHTFQDDTIPPRRGNGNGIPEPFEIGSLLVSATNVGAQAVNPAVVFNLATEGPGVQILEGRYNHQVRINPGAGVEVSFLLSIQGNFPAGRGVPFTLTVNAGNNQWRNEFSLQGRGASWAMRRVSLEDDPLPGMEVWFNVELINNGDYDLDSTRARLESLTEYAEAMANQAVYPPLEIGEAAIGDVPFSIGINENAPYEADLPLILRLQSDDGYSGEVTFTLKVVNRPSYQPTGPDPYGYWAIDNTDTTYNLVPRVEWLEISPFRGGRGWDLGLRDSGEDQDTSTVINLPFEFSFYGRRYSQITVCTNGWIAPGDQRGYRDFRNLPIGSPMGPRGIIAAWWDNLYNPYPQSGVFAFYDTAQHRFILQWQGMRRWVGPDGPGAEETFQTILYDPLWHPTLSGDGDILFLYRQISLEGRVDGHDTPFPTVGIGSPDGRYGLQYYFWGQYGAGAASLVSGRSIRFATAPHLNYGRAGGRVVALRDNRPISGATVRSSRGGWAVTDGEGLFTINNIIAERPFTLIASAPGFNTQSSGERVVRAGEFVEVSFALTQPSLNVNLEEIVDSIAAGRELLRRLLLTNQGDGELNFEVRIEPHRPPQGGVGGNSLSVLEGRRALQGQDGIKIEDDRKGRATLTSSMTRGWSSAEDGAQGERTQELWDRLTVIYASDSTGDQRLVGAAFDGEEFWVSGGDNGQESNYLYRFRRGGTLVGRVELPIRGPWGLRDLCYREPFLYGGATDSIYKLSRQGEIIAAWPSPLIPVQALTVDPGGNIWVGSSWGLVYQLSPQGQVLRRITHTLPLQGLAWHPADDAGMPLWLLSAEGARGIRISRMDTSSGRVETLRDLGWEEGDRVGGGDLTLRWDDRKWVMVSIVQNPAGDRVEVWEVGPNLSWLSVQPRSGQLPPQTQRQIEVTLSARELNGGEYQADLVVYHNAPGGTTRIPVRFIVRPLLSTIDERELPGNFHWSLFPNPSNGALTVRLFMPQGEIVEWGIYDLQGRRLGGNSLGMLKAGYHQLNLAFPQMGSGVYLITIRRPHHTHIYKWALVR